ncbi:hypothetical protein [Nocardia spumae]|uniref:hypothetical protein n=1 Tax=Nocardia spumae TaxID=2887190 RepID=UPI001D142363|nr:hypothetical protein [Nocardia spumae]
MAGIVRGDSAWSWRALLAGTAGAVAACAFAGSVVLITRRSAGGDDLARTLGWHSLVAGAVILALVVGIPMAVTAGSVLVGDRRAATVAVASGTLLICWVLGQMAVVHTLSWLQPVYLLLGVGVAALGLHIRTAEIES